MVETECAVCGRERHDGVNCCCARLERELAEARRENQELAARCGELQYRGDKLLAEVERLKHIVDSWGMCNVNQIAADYDELHLLREENAKLREALEQIEISVPKPMCDDCDAIEIARALLNPGEETKE